MNSWRSRSLSRVLSRSFIVVAVAALVVAALAPVAQASESRASFSTGWLVPYDAFTGEAVAGVTVDIRDPSCTRTFSRNVSSTIGISVVAATGATYCAVVVAVPEGYAAPAPQRFTVTGLYFEEYLELGFAPQLGQFTLFDGTLEQRVAGAVVDIMDPTCSRTFSRNVTNALGSFFVIAYPGTYCVVPIAVPAGYALPLPSVFEVVPGVVHNWALEAPSYPYDGDLLATDAVGSPVPGVWIQIRSGDCSTTFSSMQTNDQGLVHVIAFPGVYCVVTTSVPPGFYLTVPMLMWIDQQGFLGSWVVDGAPVAGQLIAFGGVNPQPGVVVQIRDSSCTNVISQMTTAADGTFPISAYPGHYCAVPVSVPPEYQLPAPVQFTVYGGVASFQVEIPLVFN